MIKLDDKCTVRAWRERITIPTYEAGQPDANPVFLEKRVYQGSSGAVYPYPIVESISDEKVAREYEAIFLENEYLKIMILPELGGRQDEQLSLHLLQPCDQAGFGGAGRTLDKRRH